MSNFPFPVAHESSPVPRIVALGGGTGLPAVLRGVLEAGGLSARRADDVTAIVTVMDDGGSSGRLRKSLGMLPPGDIRNCLAALSPSSSLLAGIVNDRAGFQGADIHPVGNLLLAALNGVHGDFVRAIDALARMMDARGRVLPATLDHIDLHGSFSDGAEVIGESGITARGGGLRRISLSRPARPLPEALDALERADLVVVGPGSLYTSLIPTLLVDGIAETISTLKTPRVYVANLMTQHGETDGYTVADHLAALREHTGFDLFDYVLVNRQNLDTKALDAYAQEGSVPVALNNRQPWTFRTRIVTASIGAVTADGVVRHDPLTLGYALTALARRRRTLPWPAAATAPVGTAMAMPAVAS